MHQPVDGVPTVVVVADVAGVDVVGVSMGVVVFAGGSGMDAEPNVDI